MALYHVFRQSLRYSSTIHKNPFCLKFKSPCKDFTSLIDSQNSLLYNWRTINSIYNIALDFEGYGPSDQNAELVNEDYIVRKDLHRYGYRHNTLYNLRTTRSTLEQHNYVLSLLRAGDLDAAVAYTQANYSYHTPTVFTCNAIIVAMLNAKRYNDAIGLFQYFFELNSHVHPNMASFNLLLKAYLDAGQVAMGIKVYDHVLYKLRWRHSPVMYRVLTKGLVETRRVFKALDILQERPKIRGKADSIVYNNLIKGFLDLGDLRKANELFEELKEKCTEYDGVVNATFMDWFFKKGKEKEAMEMYKSLLDRGIIKMSPDTGNTLLNVLLKHGKDVEAWKLFDQMLGNHTPPVFHAVDSNSYNIMVNECFKSSKYSQAIEVFKRSGKQLGSKPFAKDILGYNNIIAKFCEHKLLLEAENLFEELSSSKSLSPDAMTYRTLIEAYLKEERLDDALRLLTKMVQSKLRVTATFGNIVFDELVKKKKLEKAAEILEIMGESKVNPDSMNYEIVIRGLCNENLLGKSRNLIMQMLKHKVGITPTLWKYLPQIFGKARWSNEVEDECRQQYSTGHSSLTQSLRLTGQELQSQDNMRKLKEKVEAMERKYANMQAQINTIKSTSYTVELPY